MSRSRLTMGIDEAGRGPALGPMVLAAVVLDMRGAEALERAGLADSKSYGSGKKGKATREQLAEQVHKQALFIAIRVVDVREVDRRVRLGELNVVEREMAEQMIRQGPGVGRIVCDGERLFHPLRSKYPQLEALNNGESAHTSVAAASVIAKTRRDALFAIMQRRYRGRFGAIEGGGYVNAATKRFLVAYATAHGGLPPEARRSWPYEYLRELLGESLEQERREQPSQLGLFG